MQRRWLAGLGIAAAAGIAFVAIRGDDAAPRRVPTAAPVRAAAPHGRRSPQPVREQAGRVYVNGGAGDPSPGVTKWKEPGLPGTFSEMVAPDDGENVEEKLLYKKRRLRFRLDDAAAACYQGGEGRQAISLAYTLVVEHGVLRVDGLRVLTSNLSDRALEQCIVDAVRSLRSDASGMPDLREEQKTTISQHDLYVHNRTVD